MLYMIYKDIIVEENGSRRVPFRLVWSKTIDIYEKGITEHLQEDTLCYYYYALGWIFITKTSTCD